jgi:hypothetical protein
MIGLLRKLPWAIRVAKRWETAVDRAAHQKYEEASNILQQLAGDYGGEIGSKEVPYFVNLLAADLLRKLGTHSQSISVALVAVSQVNSDKRLSEFEKMYLNYHAGQGIHRSIIQSQDASYDPLKDIDVRFEEIVIEKIPRRLIQEFPIVDPKTGEVVRR